MLFHVVSCLLMTRLDRLPPLSGLEAAAVAAVVAQSLADLHAAGTAHGSVGPGQVRIDDDGSVHLVAPAEHDDRATVADDIAALGKLLDWLAGRAPDRPPRRVPLVAPVPPVDELRRLALRCSQPAELGPTAHEVAASLRARVPDARFPTPGVAAVVGERGAPALRHRRRVVLGSAAAMAVAGAVVLPIRCAHRPAVLDRPARPSWADGVLVVDGRRYAVGSPGDDVAIGRWRCGTAPAVVLLRAATGDIVLFDRLPTDHRALTGRVLARAIGARRLLAGRDVRGCATLAVVHADGRRVPVEVEVSR